MTRTELREWCEKVGIDVDKDGWDRIERLVGLWRQYGRAINLVGGTDASVLYEHVQEALLGVGVVDRVLPEGETCRWVDVGSGGGLPALVVAAVRSWEMELIEPRERRAAFLDLGLASVGRVGGRVVRGRWAGSTWNEKVFSGLESRGEVPFFVLSSRAVFSADRWMKEVSEAGITRGVVLCHVDSGVHHVGGREAGVEMACSRWAVLGFPVGNVGQNA